MLPLRFGLQAAVTPTISAWRDQARMAKGLGSVRVSALDVPFASHAVAYLVGPFDQLDDPDRLRRRLRAIAQGGPPNRIGLLPDPNRRRWRFDSTCSSVAVCEGPAIDSDDPLGLFNI